jgi:hypothetical protein
MVNCRPGSLDFHSRPFATTLRWSLVEAALGLGSQCLCHSLCVLLPLATASAGGIMMAGVHRWSSSLLIGVGVYIATIAARCLWISRSLRPTLTSATLGLALSVVIIAGIAALRSHTIQPELNAWYAATSESDRRLARENVRRWMEKQSPTRRTALTETAQLMGYASVEDYVFLTLCGIRNAGQPVVLDEATEVVSSPGELVNE